MTPQERCDNAYLVAIGIEGQYGPESPPAARAFVAADGICALGGVTPSLYPAEPV